MELSAVQVDEQSSYMAEDTSFQGFAGEVGGTDSPNVSIVLTEPSR